MAESGLKSKTIIILLSVKNKISKISLIGYYVQIPTSFQ